MTPLFRAKPFTGTDLNIVQTVTLPMFDRLNAYPNVAAVEAELAAFYAANPLPPPPAPTNGGGGGGSGGSGGGGSGSGGSGGGPSTLITKRSAAPTARA